mmetsp:Transcript_11301/g.38609  ORF Transcript_11301/g.38609 Transcript_11301/m.38609 type:complete len:206 (+) Transcript_11301:997-1614(+)
MSASAIAKRMAETLLPAQMGRNKHGRESMLKVHNESGDVIDDLFFCLPAAQRATAQLGGSFLRVSLTSLDDLNNLLVRQKLPHSIRSNDHELVLLFDLVRHDLWGRLHSHTRCDVVADGSRHGQSRKHHVGQPNSVRADGITILIHQGLDPSSAADDSTFLIGSVWFLVDREFGSQIFSSLLIANDSSGVARVCHDNCSRFWILS